MSSNVFNDQAAFMQACGQSTSYHNFKQYDMYRTLIAEEVQELDDADATADTAEIADALIDILVVTIGAGLSLGLPMQALWDEVVRSNNSKRQPDGTVLKREDGKIMKPPTYSPPDIEGVLRKHGWFQEDSGDE